MRVVEIIMNYTRPAGNLNRGYTHKCRDSNGASATRPAWDDGQGLLWQMKLKGPLHRLISNRISERDRILTLGHGKILRGRKNTYRLLAIIEFQVIRAVRVCTAVRNSVAVRYNFQHGLILHHWLYVIGSLHSHFGEKLLRQPVGSTAQGNLRSSNLPTNSQAEGDEKTWGVEIRLRQNINKEKKVTHEQGMDESGRRIILRKQETEVGGFGVIGIMAFCFLMRWEDGGTGQHEVSQGKWYNALPVRFIGLWYGHK